MEEGPRRLWMYSEASHGVLHLAGPPDPLEVVRMFCVCCTSLHSPAQPWVRFVSIPLSCSFQLSHKYTRKEKQSISASQLSWYDNWYGGFAAKAAAEIAGVQGVQHSTEGDLAEREIAWHPL